MLIYNPMEVMKMQASEFFSKFLESGVGKGIAAVAGLIASVATIYKFFVEFVEADEMAVRARNNQPDYYCQKMTALRKVVIFGSLANGAALVVLHIVWDIMEFWLVAGYVVAALVAVIAALVTWPRTDQLALIGPGIHLKIPGYRSYKKGRISLRTRRVILRGVKDATSELLNVEIVYVTCRIHEVGELLWRSVNLIADLEESLQDILRVAVSEVVGSIRHARLLSQSQVNALAPKVQRSCESDFRDTYGSTLKVWGFAQFAEPESVASMRVLTEVRKGCKFGRMIRWLIAAILRRPLEADEIQDEMG